MDEGGITGWQFRLRLGGGDAPVTVNFLPGSVDFVKPSGGVGDPSAIYRFGWDDRRPEGYSFRHVTQNTVADTLPGGVT